MVLFGSTELSLADTRGVVVKETFRKAGKAWKGKRDKQGFCVDENGNLIKTADILTFLPTKSKDNEDMADLTGLKGESLKLHNLDVRRQAAAQAFGIITEAQASGNYVLANNGLKRGADGSLTLRLKPTAMRVVRQVFTDDELIAEAVKRGLVAEPKK